MTFFAKPLRKFANKKIKVLAGTGGNSTSEAVYLTKAAEDAGAPVTPVE